MDRVISILMLTHQEERTNVYLDKKFKAAFAFLLSVFVCWGSGVSLEALEPHPMITPFSSASDKVRIGVDGEGNIVSLWKEYDGLCTHIYSAALPQGKNWSTLKTLVSKPGNEDLTDLQIA